MSVTKTNDTEGEEAIGSDTAESVATEDAGCEVLFTKQMKRATREVHSLSDALINAKLGVAFGSSRVWAEGLLVFYEIFRVMEETMDRCPDSLIARLDFPGVRRTPLFEKDLFYYLGPDWKVGYSPRPTVAAYIAYLQQLESRQPELLLAYAYHLYMGLLSGGQILRRKRALLNRIKFRVKDSYEGLAVTEISGVTVYQLKKQIADTTNTIADQELDADTRAALIEESKRVFEWNDKIVRSIEGTTSALLWRLTILSVVVGIVGFLLKRSLFS